MGPYEILQRVGKVAYKYELYSELASVYLVSHVSMMEKCIANPESILSIDGLCFKDNLSYEEVLVQILDKQVKKLWNKQGAFLKGVMEKSSS